MRKVKTGMGTKVHARRRRANRPHTAVKPVGSRRTTKRARGDVARAKAANPSVANNDNVPRVARGRIAAARPSSSAALYNRAVMGVALTALTLVSGALVWFGVSAPTPADRRVAEASVERAIDAQVAARRDAGPAAQPLIVGALTPIPDINVPVLTPEFTDLPAARKPHLTRAERLKLLRQERAERRAQRLRQREGTAQPAADDAGRRSFASVPGAHDLIATARRYLGTNPTGWAHNWCGAFLDMVLRRTGYRGGGNLAMGYVKYGHRLPGPQIGAIAVFSRPGGGHVGIVTGVDSNGNPVVISGNFRHRVAEATFPARRVVAYVSPAPIQ